MEIRLKKIIIFFIITIFSSFVKAQKLQVNGFFSQMSQTIVDTIKGNWLTDQILQNRLKIQYSPFTSMRIEAQARTRLIYGNTIQMSPNIDLYEKDKGFLDLNFALLKSKSAILNTNIDRLYFQYELSKFKITLGRQRVNWGMTFVWNTNDWFNTYSFVDFDYAERPGSDAINLQFFPTALSSADFVTKIDSTKNITTAIRYKFNLKNYDIQFLAGIIENEDIAAGMGWSGSIWQLTFRAEATYLHSKSNFAHTTGKLITSIGFDYMFKNSFTIFAEFLFNQYVDDKNTQNIFQLQNSPANLKTISVARYNSVFNMSYPINPIFNASLSYMYMSYNDFMMISPNLSASINDYIDFSIVTQHFLGKILNPITLKNEQKLINIFYLRLKFEF